MQSRMRRETKSFNIPDAPRDLRRSQEKIEDDPRADISLVSEKPPSSLTRGGGFSVIGLSLRHSQRLQRWLIDCRCVCQPVGTLVIRDRSPRLRPEQTIHFTLIITLLLQGSLDIGDHLIRRQVVIGVNRAIIWIIRVGIVAPGGVPVARIQGIPSTKYEYDVVRMAAPPVPIVPLRFVIPENLII